VADSSKASYVPDLASEIDSVADEVQEKWGVSRKAAFLALTNSWAKTGIGTEAVYVFDLNLKLLRPPQENLPSHRESPSRA
jgi:hypothetical protein